MQEDERQAAANGSAATGGVSRYMHVPFAEIGSPAMAAEIQAAEQLADPDAAAAALRTLAQRSPESADAWFALAGCYDTNGYEEEAVDCYEKALGLGPDGAWSRYLHLQLASSYRTVGRLEDAHLLISQGIERFPEFHVLQVMRAFVEHDLGRHADAVRSLAGLLIEVAPESVAPYGRAIGYYKDAL